MSITTSHENIEELLKKVNAPRKWTAYLRDRANGKTLSETFILQYQPIEIPFLSVPERCPERLNIEVVMMADGVHIVSQFVHASPDNWATDCVMVMIPVFSLSDG